MAGMATEAGTPEGPMTADGIARSAQDATTQSRHADDPVLTTLQQQIEWYDGAANRADWVFKAIKLVQIGAAALIPFFSGAEAGGISWFGVPTTWLISGIGVLLVVLEGVQQLFKFQENWLRYRATCEALRGEQLLYLAGAGPYADGASVRLLAARMVALIQRENAQWIAAHGDATETSTQQAAASGSGAKTPPTRAADPS